MQYAPGLKAIQFADDAPAARTDADSGLCQINARLWETLSREERYFLLLHEQAHLTRQTTDDAAADAQAISRFRQRFPRSMAPLTLLHRVLQPAYAEHRARLDRCQFLLNHA